MGILSIRNAEKHILKHTACSKVTLNIKTFKGCEKLFVIILKKLKSCHKNYAVFFFHTLMKKISKKRSLKHAIIYIIQDFVMLIN